VVSLPAINLTGGVGSPILALKHPKGSTARLSGATPGRGFHEMELGLRSLLKDDSE